MFASRNVSDLFSREERHSTIMLKSPPAKTSLAWAPDMCRKNITDWIVCHSRASNDLREKGKQFHEVAGRSKGLPKKESIWLRRK
jgi:hypothetical protein